MQYSGWWQLVSIDVSPKDAVTTRRVVSPITWSSNSVTTCDKSHTWTAWTYTVYCENINIVNIHWQHLKHGTSWYLKIRGCWKWDAVGPSWGSLCEQHEGRHPAFSEACYRRQWPVPVNLQNQAAEPLQKTLKCLKWYLCWRVMAVNGGWWWLLWLVTVNVLSVLISSSLFRARPWAPRKMRCFQPNRRRQGPTWTSHGPTMTYTSFKVIIWHHNGCI